MATTSGTKLGPYEIVGPLGAGGMGEVYRAKDTRLDRTVAIKVLASHLSSSPEFKQRLGREARAISSLNHPHICHLYDVGSQDGTDYLVMEFLEGETLAERLRKGAMPMSEIIKIGTDVADALGRSETGFSTFMDLLRADLAAAVRDTVRGRADPEQLRVASLRPLDAWGEVWQGLTRLQDETERFSLDKRQALIQGLGLLSPGKVL